MTSLWQYGIHDERETAASRLFPARLAAIIAILAAVMLADTMPQFEPALSEELRAEQRMPSACGAEAVARANREVNRSRAPSPTAFS